MYVTNPIPGDMKKPMKALENSFQYVGCILSLKWQQKSLKNNLTVVIKQFVTDDYRKDVNKIRVSGIIYGIFKHIEIEPGP